MAAGEPVTDVYFAAYGPVYGTPFVPPPTPVPFPQAILDVAAELLLDGWTDVTPFVYQRDGSEKISVTRGRPDESTQATPSSAAFQLNNRDGRFTSRNPLGPYYGMLGRNTPIRFSVPEGSAYLRMEDNQLDASGTKAVTPSSAALNVSGNLDVRIDCAVSNWQPCTLAAKWTTSGGNRSWALNLDDDGNLEFWWSPDGTSVIVCTSTMPLPPGRLAARATLTLSSGTATFYTGPAGGAAGGTWTQLGLPLSISAATTVFAGTGELGVGRSGGVNQDNPAFFSPNGKFYEFVLMNGIGGTVVADPVFTSQPAGVPSFADGQGNTWTLGGAAELSDRKYRAHLELSSLPTQWDSSGTDVWTPVTAGGLLRRLAQANAPLDSALKRATLAQSGTLAPVAYWPGEDLGKATQIASALGGPPMEIAGTAAFAADSSFACSSAIPQWSSSGWYGRVPAYANNGAMVCRFLFHSTSPPPDKTRICRVLCTGTIQEFTLIYDAGGGLTLSGWDSQGNSLFSTGPIAFGVDNELLWVSMELQQTGSHVQYSVTTLQPGATTGLTTSGTLASTSVGNARQVQVNPNATGGTVGMGHVSVQGDWVSLFSLFEPLNAWQGEAAGDRFARLCGEQGIACRIVGAPAVTGLMGIQAIDTLPSLLQACEDADRGQVFEPRTCLGLGYRTYASLCNQAPAVTIDYSLAQLVGLVPTEDDQLTRNDVTATRDSGSSFRAVLGDGSAMSVSDPPVGVGDYSYSQSVNCFADDQLGDIATWIMHVGTANEQRYPTLAVNLARSEIAALFAALQDADIGDYIEVVNPPAWQPPGPVKVLLYGVAPEEFGGYTYAATWNAVPESPYEVGIWGDATYGHLDTGGSSLAAGIGTGDATMSVATAAGSALWTTRAADFPFDVSMGGEQITVTAVTGSSSPQSFAVTRSVNGVAKSHTAGEDVRLAHPMILALV
ncbi:MAG TPA: hypothetical protein VIZ43_10935 [Trebonia sp.]